MDRNDINSMTNVLFKNHSYLYYPWLEKEPKQKLLKFNTD